MARAATEVTGFPPKVEIGENTVTISFREESENAQHEAERLAERADKRAGEGNYGKAISIWKRVLELSPSSHKARRDLAMACMEMGDTESAKDHLIDVLRVNPTDAWGWVVLYSKDQKDWATAEKFLRRALEIAPNDPWALNGLAAITAQRGQTDNAVRLFEQAITANPSIPNPYYGLGVTFHRTGRPDLAARALDRLFLSATLHDPRAKGVFDQARALYARVQDDLAKHQHSEAFKAVENLRAELERSSGYSVRVTEGEFKDKTTATIQMAWKHRRDHHLIKVRTSLPDHIRPHLMAHELMHLQLEAEARKVGKNRFFTTTTATEQRAIQRFEGDMSKLQRKGYPAEAVQGLMKTLVQGLANFLYNCPLDMLIESKLRREITALSASQFNSLHLVALESLEANSNPEIVQIAPKIILRASLAMNGAYALFLDDLFHRGTAYTLPYQRSESFAVSQKLFRHWQTRYPQLGAGDEYTLVDEFAEMVGLKGWYEWKPDPGTHEVTAAAFVARGQVMHNLPALHLGIPLRSVMHNCGKRIRRLAVDAMKKRAAEPKWNQNLEATFIPAKHACPAEI